MIVDVPSETKKADTMQRPQLLLSATLSIAMLLSGCAGSNNKGGDTTCEEFNSHDSSIQTADVAQMLEDQKGKEASNMEVTVTKLSVQAFCKTLGKQSNKIRDISTG